jgi:hypothetical protein
MKHSYTETETATVRVELSLRDLQLLRRVTQYALEKDDAPYGAKNLVQPIDRALVALAEDMRRTAETILDQ